MAAPGTFTSGQVLTAAEMNALPGGIVGFNENSTDVSLSNSSTDLTSITLDVVSGRSYAIWFVCHNMKADQSNTIIVFSIRLTGTGVVSSSNAFLASTTARTNITPFYIEEAAASESREYKVTASTNTGTGSAFGASYPMQMFIADLGENV